MRFVAGRASAIALQAPLTEWLADPGKGLASHGDAIAERELAAAAALTRWLRRVAGSGHHSTSTCAMGPATSRLAVVDEACRVRGLERLRVVDASVLPWCVRANPNAPTMMVAEQIAADLGG